jgi:hypothetical protein
MTAIPAARPPTGSRSELDWDEIADQAPNWPPPWAAT